MLAMELGLNQGFLFYRARRDIVCPRDLFSPSNYLKRIFCFLSDRDCH